MQLGTRWSVGQQTPDTLPQAVVDAVRAEEAELVALGVETSSWRWTLTWLERRPIVELDDESESKACTECLEFSATGVVSEVDGSWSVPST